MESKSPYRVSIPIAWDIEDHEPCVWVDCFNQLLEPTGWSYRESEAAKEFRMSKLRNNE